MLQRLAQLSSALLLIAAGHIAAQDGLSPGDAQREALRQFLESNIVASESFDDRFDAEVWLVDMSARLTRYVPDADSRLQLLRQIHAAASRSSLAPELVLAVIEVESHFDRFAVSRVGAQGLMQVMPFWKNEIGRPDDNLTDNLTNLDYGCRILQFYLQREDGVLHRALAAYNGSSGRRVYSDKVELAWREHWRTSNLNWSD
ncbi:lytic transglycosylase domain-containing protein [Congregibacter brevis]|uniref:Lytic transglycosylase domain-containing protein n=1 Tax=Congregibacter brevis TaxID=3081201 RepID=A0ABZ0IFY1_9GAMM|nr:lytic transglycosylase domain-containing protein [Congregibacter sp. IMCC45268]